MTLEARKLLIWLQVAMLGACDDGDNLDPPAGAGEPGYQRDPALDIELVSEAESDASHEVGTNCMQCHQALGPGPGRFTAAGTIYDADGLPKANADVELRAADGSPVTVIPVDRLGNFYTTEPLPVPDAPVFPVVVERGGPGTAAMPFPTSSASCNVCHTGDDGVRIGSE